MSTYEDHSSTMVALRHVDGGTRPLGQIRLRTCSASQSGPKVGSPKEESSSLSEPAGTLLTSRWLRSLSAVVGFELDVRPKQSSMFRSRSRTSRLKCSSDTWPRSPSPTRSGSVAALALGTKTHGNPARWHRLQVSLRPWMGVHRIFCFRQLTVRARG